MRVRAALILLALALPLAAPAQQPPPSPRAPEGAAPAGQRRATPRCYRAIRLRDEDLRRNAGRIDGDRALCVSLVAIYEGGRTWRFSIVRNLLAPDRLALVVLHDDEDTAFDTGLEAVQVYGGTLVALDTGGQRTNEGQDPNHNFGGAASLVAPCRRMRDGPSPEFTAEILRHFGPDAPVLSLHNNHDGHAATGGAGDFSVAVNAPGRRGLAAPGPARGLADPDNAILIPGRVPYDQDRAAQGAVAYFHRHGINVIHEWVTPGRNDCSLSNHVALTRRTPYYNVEVQHGAAAEQGRMLGALMRWLGIAPLQ
ncbi:hypothetical protein GLS40_16380 [Pseudooceanicola sp. 216_PA32_1]|uniref:N-acetylmuramoyl-L-alanine amidase n=1 Tax=Pseudooceanicola pacificus TaxID=2676438 RepID=A0A844WF53_9RHOB|nr:hypothetical protein [Pseudooceanicola pacificus]MWB79612.1 hypothetical protein [Pseudooceanicola pacificus]